MSTWTVTSELMDWPPGTELTEHDLTGLFIDGLVSAGHLAGPPCPAKPPPAPPPPAEMRELHGAALTAILGADG